MNRYRDVFKGKEDLLREVALFNPIEVKVRDRMRTKFMIEENLFDPERYAFDNYDDEQLEDLSTFLDLKGPKIPTDISQEME